MIDPAKLTAENGFVDGCVVMVKESGWRERPMSFRIGENKHGHYIRDPHAYAYFSNIESIRPLTGPMAIWNFAPGGAVACISDVSGIKWVYADDYEHVNLIRRPWWARSEK